MATLPIANSANPLPAVSTLAGFPNATLAKRFSPLVAVEPVLPVVDLAALVSDIPNPIEANPVFPLPSGSGGGSANPVGYAS